ncbi:MAG TPA: CPBP family intramembrane glutamic endopeptidase [Bacteroidia bacterium]|nr:CPBP family intramembrane glutamic endopeptidase [Bacteroidia bacterium]
MNEISPKKIRLFELLLVVLIPLLPSLISAIYTFCRNQTYDYSNTYSSYADYSIVLQSTKQLLGIALLVYVLFRQGRRIEDIGLSFRWMDIPIGIGIYALVYVVHYALYKSGHHFFPQGDFKAHNLGFVGGSYIVVFIFMFINPFYEELIVRAYAMTEIEFLSGSKIAAIVISTLFQSSYHLYQGLFPALLIIPTFLIHSLYFAKYKRIMPVIIAHLIADMVSMHYHLG